MFSLIVVRVREFGEVFLAWGRQAVSTLVRVSPASVGRWSRLLLVAALPLSLGGCFFLEALFYMNCAACFAAASFVQPKAGTVFAQLNVTAQIGGCTSTGPAPSPINVTCTLKGPGGFETTSTFVLNDLPGGTAIGAAYGAIILQLPASVTNFSGTYSGPTSGTLNIVDFTGTLAADTGSTIVPEAGNRLWVIRPPSALGQYEFIINFDESGVAAIPLKIKFMFVERVAANGRTFYPPLFPCTNSFAAIPAVTLPTAMALTPINLSPMATQQGCNNKSYSFAAAATVDVVEYHHAGFDHYFITPVVAEIALLDAHAPPFQDWSRTGHSFKAYVNATSPAASVATCRFFNDHFAPKSSHFYAAHGFGCEDTLALFPDWGLEDDKLFNTMLPDGTGACPTGTVPVYRLYNNGMGSAPNHRFVTSLAERQTMVNQGWTPEGNGIGVGLCAPG
jgi:hypothetical protein